MDTVGGDDHAGESSSKQQQQAQRHGSVRSDCIVIGDTIVRTGWRVASNGKLEEQHFMFPTSCNVLPSPPTTTKLKKNPNLKLCLSIASMDAA